MVLNLRSTGIASGTRNSNWIKALGVSESHDVTNVTLTWIVMTICTTLANVGVPMLFVQMPILLTSLPVIIVLEACLCRRCLKVSWRGAWQGSALANAASTVLGFPVLWIALVIIELLLGGGGFPNLTEPWFSIYTVTVQAPWLLPIRDRLYWMVPTACLVLMIPAFFMSVAVERRIYSIIFLDRRRDEVTRAIWKMHLVSYSLLVAVGLTLLMNAEPPRNLEDHDSPSNESVERMAN